MRTHPRGSFVLIATVALSAGPALGLSAGPALGQDMNLPLAPDSVEYLLERADFELISDLVGTRFEGDRTQRVELSFDDGTVLFTKWAPAPRGGDEPNNSPRFEVAAYEFQKLFLDDPEFVVPPTVARAVDLDWYRTLDDRVDPTIGGAESVIVVLQSFLAFVTDEDVFVADRFESDPTYARHWANANLFTHLIFHSDSNVGNLMISSVSSNPRVFAVDNGLAFGSVDSNRGTRWRNLLVDRFPTDTVDRLRGISEEQLYDALEILVEWREIDDRLVLSEPSENLRVTEGVRSRDGVVQLGLTADEIDDVWDRMQDFLGAVDSGRYTTF